MLPYKVILPQNYSTENGSFPVIYLLHGLFGSFENWTKNTNLIDYAKNYKFLIVCPDANDSWYSDNPRLENHYFESYILKELIANVEERFSVKKDQKSRAIAGLSMGGYGALKFALRRPELFCFAASMSGAFLTNEFFEDKTNAQWGELLPSILQVFDNDDLELRDKNDLFKIAERLAATEIDKLPFIYFDCGSEDSLLKVNVMFAELLEKLGIRHEFQIFGGGHDWDYWNQQIKIILNIADKYFSKN